MKSNEFPVEIDGKKYEVDRTFAGYPAVYVFKDGAFRHVNALESDGHDPVFHNPQNGDTIIMATFKAEGIDE